MHAISGCDSVSSFSHAGKIATFQTLKNKLDKRADMIDFGEFPSVSLESPLLLLLFNMFVIFTMRINQVQVRMNYNLECQPKII